MSVKREKLSYRLSWNCGGWDGHRLCSGLAREQRPCTCICHVGQPAPSMRD